MGQEAPTWKAISSLDKAAPTLSKSLSAIQFFPPTAITPMNAIASTRFLIMVLAPDS